MFNGKGRSKMSEMLKRFDGSKQNPKSVRTCVYFSNWSVYQKKHFAIDIPVEYITHLFYAFLAIDSVTGRLKLSDEWCDVQMPVKSAINPDKTVTGNLQQIFELKKKNRNLKVLMSIGGWGTHEAFLTTLSDKSKRAAFVDSAIQMLSEYGFDGIDVDWEYPKNRSECGLLVECLKSLRGRLDMISKNTPLTIASPAGADVLSNLNLRDIDRYVSFWNVMCYDFSGAGWSERTGYHSNLYGSNGANDMNVDDVLKYYIKSGINPDRLVMGMPLYGRVFNDACKNTIGSKFDRASKNHIVDGDTVDFHSLPLPGSIEYFDNSKVSAYCYEPHSKIFVAYDNVKSAEMKAGYILQRGLGGGMWWDSSGDSKTEQNSIIRAFVSSLGGLSSIDSTPNHLELYHRSKYLHSLMSDG